MATAGRKRTKLQRDLELEEVAKLARRGFTGQAIAEIRGVSAVQVSYDLKLIRKQYASQTMEDHAALVGEKRAQYKDIIREAWQEWERSKADAKRLVEELVRPYKKKTEKTVGEDGEEKEPEGLSSDDIVELVKIKETVYTEGRLAEVAFLRIVCDCLKAERELLGLDAPKRVDMSGTSHQFHWDMLMQPPQGGTPVVVDAVERRIQELLDGSVAPNTEIVSFQGGEERLPNGLTELPPETSNGTNGAHHGQES